MKVGLVITTYNRSEYTKQCFESLCPLLPIELFIVLVDDCSTEEKAIYLFDNVIFGGVDIISLRNHKNLGIAKSLEIGFDSALNLKQMF